MAKEIERKFRVKGRDWAKGPGVRYRQGYLSRSAECTVRVRIAGDKGFLTVKGKTTGASRDEYEYPIPREDAEAMLASLCDGPVIEKTRYRIENGELTWEVDEFSGENHGLIVAEIELPTEDHKFDRPDWIGEEVTHDPRYQNSNLVKHPFTKW